ncbi:ABC transporter substrate-binding protein [Anaeromyxobacter sp. Red801]|uniref:ABC transporter substrate-binding protein n=1 Tax=Anaeromyxobacter sp. Red801 TaxID=3411632 RepID=UPI003B9F6178
MRVASLIAAMALLAACGDRRPPRTRLVLASVRQPATALPLLAAASGCFAAEGLDLEERSFDLGRDALALLREGGADVAVAFETPVLQAAYADDRLRALTALHTSTRNTRLVVRASSGIRGFSDLGGRRIGLAPGTNADFFTDLALRLGGVPRDQVRLVHGAPAESIEGLAAGALDAAVLSDPAAQEAERRLGDDAQVFQTDLYVEISLLVTRDDVLAARPAALRALLRGLACGERRARADREGARARIRDRFPETGDAALAGQLERVRWGLGLDNVLVDVLRRERDALTAAGALRGDAPDLHQLVAPALLEQVAPESVMLLPGDARW